MINISLNGKWQLYHFPEAHTPILHPDDLKTCDAKPIPADVPGNVETALMKAGLLEDPFLGDNSHSLRAYEACEWWYVREFTPPSSPDKYPWEIEFEGLDFLATVWLNGKEIGRSDNALIPFQFDVTRHLRFEQPNVLAVRLGSAMRHARTFDYEASVTSWEHRQESVHLRKPAHCWGWDIMPRIVSAGIWRSVTLRERANDNIESLYYWTQSVGHDGAELGVRFRVNTVGEDMHGLSMVFRGSCGHESFEHEQPLEFVADDCRIRIPGARLWWPRGYGEPSLYTIRARLCRGGKPLAERVDKVGLRRIEVQRTEGPSRLCPQGEPAAGTARIDVDPNPESHFLVRCNGVPIMVMGANWTPLDALHSRDGARLQRAVEIAENLGCNMLRCWGGGVYEEDAFFDLCDEKGIMVWQDFAFACCRYPQNNAFLARVEREARAVVARLRNHACLALWCGDCEVDMVYAHESLRPELNRVNREVLPCTVHRLDPHRHFLPSSPLLPENVKSEPSAGGRIPEQHLWGPRGYFKSDFYTRHSAHFIGEIGYHGCPNAASVKQFISPAKVWPWQDNPEWQAHAVDHWQGDVLNRDRIQLMANQVYEYFGMEPTDLGTFSWASQVVQAEALKFFIESTRLRKWDTSGILWWNLTDGWPQFSDSVTDYYFAEKLACRYIERVQHPVCVIIGETGPGKYMPIVACNDTREDQQLTWLVTDGESGQPLADGDLVLPAGENWQVGRIRAHESEHRLLLIEWELTHNRHGANHRVVGHPPFSANEYRGWLAQIANLPRPFDHASVGR